MQKADRFPSVGDRPGIIHKVIGRAVRRGVLASQRGFTLIELLAVMSILGVLAAIVATGVGGLGSKSTDTRLVGDASTLSTAVDRFFTEAFPQKYPVVNSDSNGDSLFTSADSPPNPAGDVGVRELNFDIGLPQTPSKKFVPDFLKEIPASSGQVSWRINKNTGFVFPTEYGAAMVLPSESRLTVTATTSTTGAAASTVINAISSHTLALTMNKNEAAVEILEVEIPAGYNIGGGSITAENYHIGTLTGTLGPDNDIEPGETIVFGGPLLTTTEPSAWKLVVNYGRNLSTTTATQNRSTLKGTLDVRVHTVSVSRPTSTNPGKLILTMDRETDDPDYNRATETWQLELFGTTTHTFAATDFIDDSGVVASGIDNDKVLLTATAPSTFKVVVVPTTSGAADVIMVKNPSTAAVYRWLAEEQTTIDVAGIFDRVAGNQAVIIRGS